MQAQRGPSERISEVPSRLLANACQKPVVGCDSLATTGRSYCETSVAIKPLRESWRMSPREWIPLAATCANIGVAYRILPQPPGLGLRREVMGLKSPLTCRQCGCEEPIRGRTIELLGIPLTVAG